MSDIISGKSLKLLLKKKGISQQDIIKEFGMHQGTASRYFTERDKMPADFLLKVAAYAGLQLKDLIEGYTEPHTIDIPHIEVAAEPATPYIAAPPRAGSTPAAAPTPSPLVQIDVSALDIIIHELRTKLTVMEHELGKIKQELELVHH
jgi:transcriptional regulator with XRE-family HTH domain